MYFHRSPPFSLLCQSHCYKLETLHSKYRLYKVSIWICQMLYIGNFYDVALQTWFHFASKYPLAKPVALQKRVKPAVTGSHCNGMVRSDTCNSLLLATLERVFVLSESQLILKFVFFKLVLDILCDLFGIFTYCVYLVTSAPKRSVAVLVFQICMPLMYEQTAFSFEKSHEAWYTHLGRYLYQHVDMSRAHFCFYYRYAFPSA